MPEFTCDICAAPMVFVERVKSDKAYRISRFKCSICDYQRTVFCCDGRDGIIEPAKALKTINRNYQQEETNRE